MANKYTFAELKLSELDSDNFSDAINLSYEKMKDVFPWEQPSHMDLTDETNRKHYLKGLIMNRTYLSANGQWDSDGLGTPHLLCMKETDTNRQLYYHSAHSNPDDTQELVIDQVLYGKNSAGSRAYLKTDVPEIRKSFRQWLKDNGYTKFNMKVDTNNTSLLSHVETFQVSGNDADNGVREENTNELGLTIKNYKMIIPSGE